MRARVRGAARPSPRAPAVTAWRAALAERLGDVRHTEPVHGGDINDAWRVDLADGRRVFVKSHRAPPPGMYEAEARGLAWLAEGPLRVPRVLAVSAQADAEVNAQAPQRGARSSAVGDAEVNAQFLALEWLELVPPRTTSGFAAQLGRGLAGLHACGAPAFGLPWPSFVGTLAQDNTAEADAATWFVERRLAPLVARLVRERQLPGELAAQLARGLDTLRARPELLGPPSLPARLHGDLWWGNVGACAGVPVVFDPAATGGHGEIDLAMLALFGELPDALVAAYQEVRPLADGWRARLARWQLYPIAVHAVLFGGGYTAQLARGLAAIS